MRGFARDIVFVVLGAAVYGAVLAWWRSPVMAAYVAVKLPAVFVGATLVVSAFSWIAALAAGADMRYRDVLRHVFSAMAVAGKILLALAPVVLFFILSGAREAGTAAEMRLTHSAMIFVHVLVLATAGLIGNVSLYRRLVATVPKGCSVALLLSLWVSSFALVGCQLGWMMRPLVGSPNISVEFLREDALRGNFVESVFTQIIPTLMRKGEIK